MVGFDFFFSICFLISTVNTGLAPWLIFEFVFSLYFVFLKFWVRIFFCILYFWNCWFVFFSILYFWAYACVFFLNFYKKYEKHRTKIQKVHFDVQKCNLYFCIFFWYFPTLHRLHFVLLYFFRSLDMPSKNKTALDMPSKNKTANPSMYVVFSFCW